MSVLCWCAAVTFKRSVDTVNADFGIVITVITVVTVVRVGPVEAVRVGPVEVIGIGPVGVDIFGPVKLCVVIMVPVFFFTVFCDKK